MTRSKHLAASFSALSLFAALALTAVDTQASERYLNAVSADMRPLISEEHFTATVNRLDTYAVKLPEEKRVAIAASPCAGSISELAVAGLSNATVRQALQLALDGMQDPPASAHTTNPWKGAANVDELLDRLVGHTLKWCVALPQINGNADDGLKYMGPMYWFSYQNPAGKHFAQGVDPAAPPHRLPDNLNFLKDFSIETGKFMDSAQSAKNVQQWVDDPRIEIADYKLKKAEDYTSWNHFFTREIEVDTKTQTIPSRPTSMPQEQYPERDYLVVSPTDCIMNPLTQVLTGETTPIRRFIESPLQLNTVLDVKNIPISVDRLLGSTTPDIKQKFVGGTGLSCILMPNTYHHFHAPVSGRVIHAEIVKGPTFGYDDWANLMPSNHNPAQVGTDFSQFEVYQRGVVIIEVTYQNTDNTPLKGFVASIPVGLDTIGSVVLDPEIKPGAMLKRGYTRIGNFNYGGSMNLMLFSKGLLTGSVQTRLGNQIGTINVGRTPQ